MDKEAIRCDNREKEWPAPITDFSEKCDWNGYLKKLKTVRKVERNRVQWTEKHVLHD